MYTIHPSSRPSKHIFRVYISGPSLLVLKLQAGDLCILRESNGRDHYALAWIAAEKIQDSIVQVSRPAQDLFNLKLGDRVSILRRQNAQIDTAISIRLEDVSERLPLTASEVFHWQDYLQSVVPPEHEVLQTHQRLTVNLQGNEREFEVRNAFPLLRISPATTFLLDSVPTPIPRDAIGGLQKQVDQLQDIVDHLQGTSTDDGIPSFYRPVEGVLLYGAKGTGKSHLIELLTKCPWATVCRWKPGTSIPSHTKSCLIIIEDLALIAPSSGSSSSVTAIASLFKSVRGSRNLVIAEVRHPNDIHESLRTVGRFEEEVELPIPTQKDRFSILKAIRATSPLPDDEWLEAAAARTHGYVGADLLVLLRKATAAALARRKAPEQTISASQPTDKCNTLATISARKEAYATSYASGADYNTSQRAVSKEAHVPVEAKSGLAHSATMASSLSLHPDHPPPYSSTPSASSPPSFTNMKLTYTLADLTQALAQVRPSALQEIFLETPHTFWADIGGHHAIKRRLREAVEWPLTMVEQMSRLNLRPTKGVLLYGPPGCSKTMLVRALATEAQLNFLAVKGAELLSMYVGESERAVREVFRKARAARPSIIFFDEVDSIAATRGGGSGGELNVLTTLLNEMDGFEELRGVFVVAATNKPWVLDQALLRPGRLDHVVYVGLPDCDARREILRDWFSRSRVMETVDVGDVAIQTEGYSGAELVAVCQAAGMRALRQNRDMIELDDLLAAIGETPRGVSTEMVAEYETWHASRR